MAVLVRLLFFRNNSLIYYSPIKETHLNFRIDHWVIIMLAKIEYCHFSHQFYIISFSYCDIAIR